MSQADVPIDPDATRIRTAAGHCFRHRSDNVLVRPEIAIVANPTSYFRAAYPVQRVNLLDQRRSARGHERPKDDVCVESVRLPTADIDRRGPQVAFVPTAAIVAIRLTDAV